MSDCFFQLFIEWVLFVLCVSREKAKAEPYLINELTGNFVGLLFGVTKSRSTVVTLSEIGGIPLHFDIAKYMIRYWHKLENVG